MMEVSATELHETDAMLQSMRSLVKAEMAQLTQQKEATSVTSRAGHCLAQAAPQEAAAGPSSSSSSTWTASAAASSAAAGSTWRSASVETNPAAGTTSSASALEVVPPPPPAQVKTEPSERAVDSAVIGTAADSDAVDAAADPVVDDDDRLTLPELEAVYERTLAELLAADPLLSELPAGLTAPEVRSLTALEHGTAMAVLVNRGDQLTRLIVERTATVRDLQRALRCAVELKQERQRRPRRISWRYVWRTHWLCYKGRHLMDEQAKLEELGVTNKAEVCFVKRLRRKWGQREKKADQIQEG